MPNTWHHHAHKLEILNVNVPFPNFQKLELLKKASTEEIRQIIEGKLQEMGREPQVKLEAQVEDLSSSC